MAAASLKLAAQKDLLQWIQGDKLNVKLLPFPHDMSNNGGNRGRTDLQTTIYRINDHQCPFMLSWWQDRRTIPSHWPVRFPVRTQNDEHSITQILWFHPDADGCLTAENVQLPPKPAVYTLRISHNRPSWSQLAFEERILVRPFRHDEFPRFLPLFLFFPYYFSWIGVLIASYFILLSVFL